MRCCDGVIDESLNGGKTRTEISDPTPRPCVSRLSFKEALMPKTEISSEYSGILGWIDSRLPIPSILDREYLKFRVPRNLNYFWSFGGILMLTLTMLIISGLALGMHYKPSAENAFSSVEHIMRDVSYGWLIRYIHMNAASFFFIAVYIHIFRGLYFGSYKAPRELLWLLGVSLFFMMIVTAFLGYTLPWGQMSFWGATVITNLFSAIPVVGDSIVVWLLGGYTVDDSTLNRFYVLHWFFAFGMLAIVLLHVSALHITGSNNPSGIEPKDDSETVAFNPYMTIKDLYGAMVFFTLFALILFLMPNYLGHPDNYIQANPLVTPSHIVPEWYFLPFYAILRAIPNKLLGVIAMIASIGLLALLPWLDRSKVRSCVFRPVWKWLTLLLCVDFFVLMYAGAMPADGVFVWIARLGSLYWFSYFLFLAPLVGVLEKPRRLPRDINEYEQMKRSGEIRFLPFPIPSMSVIGKKMRKYRPAPTE
jgi:ubiquinol-cytochrome c reductase cytochrome b subunit